MGPCSCVAAAGVARRWGSAAAEAIRRKSGAGRFSGRDAPASRCPASAEIRVFHRCVARPSAESPLAFSPSGKTHRAIFLNEKRAADSGFERNTTVKNLTCEAVRASECGASGNSVHARAFSALNPRWARLGARALIAAAFPSPRRTCSDTGFGNRGPLRCRRRLGCVGRLENEEAPGFE